MLFLSLSSALAFSPAARPALPTGRSAVRPTMLLQPADLDAAQSVLDAPTLLLAKSEADELLADVFAAFPVAFSGACLGAFALQYAKKSKPLQTTSTDLPELTFAPVELPLVGSVDLPSFSTKTVDLPSLPELPDVPLPDVPEEFEDAASIAIVLAGMVFAVACSELGVINFFSGTLAKALLDGWNVFANAALPGAILKYR